MKPYASYKPSGVSWLGALPEHWEVKRVKFVSTVQPSNVDKLKVEGQVEILLCNYVDVYKNEKITSEFSLMAATATLEQINRHSLVKGDVVVTKDSESPWDIAVPTFIAEDIENLVCGYHLAKLKPYAIDGAYLVWTLRCYQVNLHFALASGGITRYGLGTSSLSDGNLPYPPTNEQIAIADYLDTETAHIDELMREKESLIGLLREYRQSVIAEAVLKGLNPDMPVKPSGACWLGDIAAHWQVMALRRLAPELATNGIFKKNEDFGEGVPLVNVGDLYSCDFCVDSTKLERVRCTDDEVAQYRVEPGDLFLVRSSLKLEGIARFALARDISEPTVFECHVVRLRPDLNACCPKFLVYYLNSSRVRQSFIARAKSTTMTTIDQGEVLATLAVCPPLNEQRAIADYLDAETVRIDELVTHTRAEINLLKELRTATIADAVLGRIDVRTQIRP